MLPPHRPFTTRPKSRATTSRWRGRIDARRMLQQCDPDTGAGRSGAAMRLSAPAALRVLVDEKTRARKDA